MKLNKVKEYNTTTFEVDDRFFNGVMVDIVEYEDGEGPPGYDNTMYEAWLYHKDIGCKELMFCIPKDRWEDSETPFDEMIELVRVNLINNPYIQNYLTQHYLEE